MSISSIANNTPANNNLLTTKNDKNNALNKDGVVTEGADLEKLGLTLEKKRINNTHLGQKEFMKVFTAQIKHQDPLDPKEGTEFISQMTQFSTTEAINRMESSLGKLTDLLQMAQTIQASDLLGKNVEFEGDTAKHSQENFAKWYVDVPDGVGELAVSIVDKYNQPVRTLSYNAPASGRLTIDWDGYSDPDGLGQRLKKPDGDYTIKAHKITRDQKDIFNKQKIQTEALKTYIAKNVEGVMKGNKEGEMVVIFEDGQRQSIKDITKVGSKNIHQYQQNMAAVTQATNATDSI